MNLDTTEWPTTRQADMQNTILCALQTSCESLRCPDELLREWLRRVTLSLPKHACANLQQQHVRDGLGRLCACVCALLESNCVSWEHIQSFTVITVRLVIGFSPTVAKPSAELANPPICCGCCWARVDFCSSLRGKPQVVNVSRQT